MADIPWRTLQIFLLLLSVGFISTSIRTPSVIEEAARQAAKKRSTCSSRAVNSRDHPYYATIVSDCNESFRLQGIIISEYHIIASIDFVPPKTEFCSFTVHPGSNGQGNTESARDAMLIKEQRISFFKLTDPIQLNGSVQPIKMIENDEEMKSGDPAVVTSVIPDSWNRNEDERVFKATVIVKSEQGCRDFVSQWRSDQSNSCKDALWIETSNLPCPLSMSSALLRNGRLAGISGNLPNFGIGGQVLDGFLNIARYREVIREYTGI
ncbi:hypothetical protein QAD02_018313 [Eretmocerus hayati]|uniref:Uncharacterized protein n=1 Tax=Eretmocerus hayati TaxID=131215 RepID=A0ACC2PGB4_9HYME|nr:hypothetical protein QAD02_018313 [Eretmocerus hayati]